MSSSDALIQNKMQNLEVDTQSLPRKKSKTLSWGPPSVYALKDEYDSQSDTSLNQIDEKPSYFQPHFSSPNFEDNASFDSTFSVTSFDTKCKTQFNTQFNSKYERPDLISTLVKPKQPKQPKLPAVIPRSSSLHIPTSIIQNLQSDNKIDINSNINLSRNMNNMNNMNSINMNQINNMNNMNTMNNINTNNANNMNMNNINNMNINNNVNNSVNFHNQQNLQEKYNKSKQLYQNTIQDNQIHINKFTSNTPLNTSQTITNNFNTNSSTNNNGNDNVQMMLSPPLSPLSMGGIQNNNDSSFAILANTSAENVLTSSSNNVENVISPITQNQNLNISDNTFDHQSINVNVVNNVKINPLLINSVNNNTMPFDDPFINRNNQSSIINGTSNSIQNTSLTIPVQMNPVNSLQQQQLSRNASDTSSEFNNGFSTTNFTSPTLTPNNPNMTINKKPSSSPIISPQTHVSSPLSQPTTPSPNISPINIVSQLPSSHQTSSSNNSIPKLMISNNQGSPLIQAVTNVTNMNDEINTTPPSIPELNQHQRNLILEQHKQNAVVNNQTMLNIGNNFTNSNTLTVDNENVLKTRRKSNNPFLEDMMNNNGNNNITITHENDTDDDNPFNI